MDEKELAHLLNTGRDVPPTMAGDPAIDAGALALCRLHCNAVRDGKSCEHRCYGEIDLGIFHSSHMNRMRTLAAAVLFAVRRPPPQAGSMAGDS